MKALYNWWKSDADFLWKGKLMIFFSTVDYFSVVLGGVMTRIVVVGFHPG